MNTQVRIALIIAVIGAAGIGTFFWATRPVAAPSNTPPVAQSTDTTSPTPSDSSSGTSEGVMDYQIDSSQSKATFEINEVLRGSPFRVIGETNQVIGEVALDMEQPSNTKVGTILVNARTLKTDSPQRDGAVGRFILQSEKAENEYIKFTPTQVTGMPDKVTVGQQMNVKITGDLTIKGTTKSVTFDAVGTLNDAGKLTGTADAKINYKDFNLTIPSVPFVASVEETVTLKVTLVANPLETK